MSWQEYRFWRAAPRRLSAIIEVRRKHLGLDQGTYIDQCARGEACIEGIDKAIAAWRTRYIAEETTEDVEDMLGLDGDDYFEWLRDPESV